MGLLRSNLSFPVLIKILEKPPSPARPRIRAVRNSIPMCVSAAYFSLFGWKCLTLAHEHPRGRKCSPGLQSLKAPVFLFISASTKLCLLCQLIFFLNRPSLLVYRHDGTYCLNPGFIISTYVKPKHFWPRGSCWQRWCTYSSRKHRKRKRILWKTKMVSSAPKWPGAMESCINVHKSFS